MLADGVGDPSGISHRVDDDPAGEHGQSGEDDGELVRVGRARV